MCSICKEIKKLDQEKALILIGKEMERSKKNRDHLSEVLDKLLGIEETEANTEADEAWERSRR